MSHLLQHVTAIMLSIFLFLPPALAAEGDAAGGPAPLGVEQLEQLVAPIALYPDSLLAQVLMAATYPLEVVSAARWSKENSKLTGKDLDAALQKQSWDASVKSLTAFPQVLRMMNEKLDWTQQLGDTFLAQQKDVMDAVQRLRAKAQAQGTLSSSKEQKVSTQKNADAAEIIVIQPAQPEVVYVPAYNPMTVYGPWPYPTYPPFAWYPPGYVAAGNLISFGLGVAAGAALWGDMDWHHNDVNINVNRYESYTHVTAPSNWRDNGGQWQHDPQHRKGVPYNNGDVAKRFRPGGDGAGTRDQERARAREAFRGHDGGPAEGLGGGGRLPGGAGEHGLRPGGGEHLVGGRDAGVRRPDGMGEHRPGGAGEHRLGEGGAGRHRPELGGAGRQRLGADGAGQRRQLGGGDRSAFHGMQDGGRAHMDGMRGAGSRELTHSHPGGGGNHSFPGGVRPHRR